MRIFLTGFMGVGKTTVGRLLAARMGVSFVDLDREVEARAGASVRRIFEQQGEAAFRDLEYQALLATPVGAVIATGGGVPTFKRNREAMGRAGVSVWLDVAWPTLAARLQGTSGVRPLVDDDSPDLARTRQLFEGRRDAYADADLHLSVPADEGPDAVAERILRSLPGLRQRGSRAALNKEQPCAT